MKTIKSNETRIVGKWRKRFGNVFEDKNCKRIEFLTKNHLIKIASDESGWSILYKDPNDGRYWEKTYLEGYMHGGGPPSLLHLTEDKVKLNYKL